MGTIEDDGVKCLQCGEARGAIRVEHLFCVIMSGYESPEAAEEFARHRFADWRDSELARFGVAEHAFDKHRRSRWADFQWIACEDTRRGHSVRKPLDGEVDGVDFFGVKVGQCYLCGQFPEQEAVDGVE